MPGNFFDQFDAPKGGNFFDRFDEALPGPPAPKPEFAPAPEEPAAPMPGGERPMVRTRPEHEPDSAASALAEAAGMPGLAGSLRRIGKAEAEPWQDAVERAPEGAESGLELTARWGRNVLNTLGAAFQTPVNVAAASAAEIAKATGLAEDSAARLQRDISASPQAFQGSVGALRHPETPASIAAGAASPGRAVLDNIAEGKPPGAPRPETGAPAAGAPPPGARPPAPGGESAPPPPAPAVPVEAQPTMPRSGMWPDAQNMAGRPDQAEANKPAPTAAPAGERAPEISPEEMARARAGTNLAPTESQKAAGNYRKGTVDINGLKIKIETPRGAERTGVDPDGNPWSTTMQNDYGYIQRTEGADGEGIDVFLGPKPRTAGKAYVIDQIDPRTGEFDEHKVVLGALSKDEAMSIYDRSFSDESGPKRRAAVTEMPMRQFKQWLKEGDADRPAVDQVNRPPAPKRPENLLEFLSRNGGLARDDGGELEAMDAHKKFLPGRGMLVRKGGMTLDAAREKAAEAGFISPDSDINDFLGALDTNLRGKHVFSDRDMTAADEWQSEQVPGFAETKQPATERTDQGEQRIIPGAERDATGAARAKAQTDRERAELGMRGKKTAAKPQEAADTSPLFGGKGKQGSLFEGEGLESRDRYDRRTGDLFNRPPEPTPLPRPEPRPEPEAPAPEIIPPRRELQPGDEGYYQERHGLFRYWRQQNGLTGESDLAHHDAARRYVIDQGAHTGWEHIVVHDARANAITNVGTAKNARFVSFPPEILDRIRDHDEDFTIHHNHPSGSSLSQPDTAQLVYQPGIKTVIAHTHGGDMSIASLTPEARAALYSPIRTMQIAAGNDFARIMGMVDTAIKKQIWPAILKKEIDGAQASRYHNEILHRALAHAGVLDYVTTRDPPLDVPAFARAQAAADKAAQAAVEASRLFERYELSHRPTEPVRPEEGLASLLERNAQAPAERPGGEARNQAGPRSARAAEAEQVAGQRERLAEAQGVREPPDPYGEEALAPEDEERRRAPGAAPPAAGGPARSPPPGGAPPGGPGGGTPPPRAPGAPPPRGPGGGPPQLPLPAGAMRQNGLIARRFLGKIFSPSTVSPIAEKQAGIQREELGISRRVTQQARAGLEAFKNSTPPIGTPEGNNLMAYIEGRSGGATLSDPAHQPIADYIRALNKNREQQLRRLPVGQRMGYIDDYYKHMWKDPQKAQQIFSTTRGPAWQGSGSFTKERVYPTYADGIAAGLEPLHPNIVDGEMAAITNVDRFIAHERIRARMQSNGTGQWFDPGRQPSGWAELQGRGTDAYGRKLYAPEDAARVFNNMIARGVYGTDLGPIYDKLMRFKNGMTAAELSLSAFHAVTMTGEAFFSEMARGIMDVASGHPIRGAGTIATSPAGFIKNLMRGREGAAEYLSPGSTTPAVRQVTDLLTRAGASPPIGRGAQQYFTAQRGAYKSIGDFKSAMGEAARDIKSSPIGAPFRQFTQQTSRILDTTMAPLFDYYIPRLKYGAASSRLADWLDQHPTAGAEEQMAAARNIVDSIDNRFGEFNYDNLMWHNAMKQASFLAMRAFGWAIGTWREIGGGVADAARLRLTERAAYVAALGVGTAMINGIMTTVKTGHAPSGMDFFAYDTGQKDEHGNEIRAMIPGYAREITGLGANMAARGSKAVGSYLYGKAASAWTTAYELLTNRDYKDEPIGPPGAGIGTAQGRAQLPEFMKRYAEEFATHYVPINWRNALGLERSDQTRGLSPAEQALAVRKAPFAVNNPQAAARFFEKQEQRPKGAEEKWKAKLKKERAGGLKAGAPP